jgi:hypothetical protein
MLDSLRQQIEAVPGLPLQAILSAATLTSFVCLLAQNRIHPIVVFLLEIYLTF